MADFWSIAIGICLAVAVCGIGLGVGVLAALFVELGQNARCRRAQRDRVKARGFVHSGCNNSLSERNNG